MNANCEKVRDLLSEFRDRELDAGEMRAIEEHLRDCKECADKSNVLASLSRVVQHWEGVKASEQTKHEVIAKAHSGSSRRMKPSVGPVTLALLGLLAAVLLGGGALLLALWYVGRDAGGEAAPVGRRPAAARCVAGTGRVELIQPDGAVLTLDLGRLPRNLAVGQELRCDTGARAQVELLGSPAGGALVFSGPGGIKLFAGELRLKGGTLVFQVPAAGRQGSAACFAAGPWKVNVGEGGAVGLVEFSADGSVRLAVLKGSAALTGASGKGGMTVPAGRELAVDAGGNVTGPRPLADERAFELLTPRGN